MEQAVQDHPPPPSQTESTGTTAQCPGQSHTYRDITVLIQFGKSFLILLSHVQDYSQKAKLSITEIYNNKISNTILLHKYSTWN